MRKTSSPSASSHGFGSGWDGGVERQRRGAAGVAALSLGQDVAGQRRGGLGAATAVLDHHGGGIARLMHRRETDEEAVVATAPRQVLVLDDAPCALGRGQGAGTPCRAGG